MPETNIQVSSIKNLRSKKFFYTLLTCALILLLFGVIFVTISAFNKNNNQEIKTTLNKDFRATSPTQILDKNNNILYVIDDEFGNDDQKLAPHFVDYVLSELNQIYINNLEEDESILDYLRANKLTIKTSLDLETQKVLEESIKNIDSEEFQKEIGAKNGAGIVLDNKTGEILAMVGSKDYFNKNIDDKNLAPKANAAVLKHNISDTVKPIVYLSLLRSGISLSSPLPDYKFDMKSEDSVSSYFPQNYSREYGEFGKYVDIRTAYENNLNVPAVAAYNLVGKNNFIDTYEKLNGSDDLETQIMGPAAALGNI